MIMAVGSIMGLKRREGNSIRGRVDLGSIGREEGL